MSGAGPLFWIASYAKSGNTWVRALIDSLNRGGAAPRLDNLYRHCPWPVSPAWIERELGLESEGLTPDERRRLHRSALARLAAAAAAGRGPRCVKVHDVYDPELFLTAWSAGAVQIVRDPRDVAPSLAKHVGESLDAAIARMGRNGAVAGGSPARHEVALPQTLGSWSEHIASWIDGFPGPLLLVRYEDLSAQPAEQVARVARFLGLPDDPETVAAAAHACRFEALSGAEKAGVRVERSPAGGAFFRRGRAGAWRGDLSAAQAARLVADHGATMARLGYCG